MLKMIFRSIWLKWIGPKLGSFGHNSYLSPTIWVRTPKQTFVGHNTFIGACSWISVHKGISIGDNVIIGPFFIAMGGDRNYKKIGYRYHQATEGGIDRPIIIEDDVFVGARVAIMKGVTVGEGAIIGTGSVVTKNVKPYTIVAGNPAKQVGERFSGEDLIRHLQLINSKYAPRP